MKTHKTCKCGTIFKIFRRNDVAISKLCPPCRQLKERAKNKKLALKNRLIRKKATKKKKKENNIPRLIKKLDTIFSRYIRKSSADFRGNIVCPCCGKTFNWKEAQNMHYVGRSNRNTRFDERNCYAGCMGCNVFKNGNYPAYTAYLLSHYGQEWLQELIKDGNKSRKFTAQELKDLISNYTELFNNL